MNTTLRRLSSVVLVMFLALMVATTWIQFGQAETLNTDDRNVRTIYREYGNARGPIVVAGDAVASSVTVDDPFGYQRQYADGPLYAPATGYFSIVNGTSGIELHENDYLNGQADSLWLDRLGNLLTGKPTQGSSVELTIDPKAQQAAWDALGDQKGAVVAVEPSTGKILAMVSKPSYDPNALAVHSSSSANQAYQDLLNADGNPLVNRTIQTRYPPGSTFKLVDSAAALESGQYTPETVVPAPDLYRLPQTSTDLQNFGGERCSGSGEMTLADALRISCNTAFAQLGVTLGDDALRDQAQKFGFDTDLSVPMPVVHSVFPPDDDADASSPPRTALAAIGQGDVATTPLQVAMLSAAIANQGELMEPYLVQTVRDPDLQVVDETTPRRFSTAVSSGTADELTQMMLGVVQSGSGKAAQIPGVAVAGKTGTAETSKEAAPHAWFTGFAPADDPKVAVAVIVEHGGSMGSEATGGAVAAPIAKAVMQAVLGG